ncbi:MAG TPA: ribosome maturation factor RimM [Clostridia bacterium]|nr:ribosome maturation factor RimM [Clostridia bacterium]
MYDYLQIGKIVNIHGVRGEVKLIPLTDDPKRFEDLEWVYVEKSGSMEKHDISGIKYVKNLVVLKLSGIDSADEAEKYRECFLLVDRKNAVKLPEGSYFVCDIIGLSVFDENGTLLGKVEDILETGSNDVYQVTNNAGKDILIPALKSVVHRISLEEQRIDVTLPKGLLDDEV